jgi:pimeloyl-ACP methyl ester carboxylesterase
MPRKHFVHNGLQIEYAEFGYGKSIVIAMHGFGREAEDFRQFVPMLRENERIVAINLFSHSKSNWPENRPLLESLSPLEHKQLLEAFLAHLNVKSFALMGYSLGGKVALTTYELMPEKVERLLLIAPDGLKVNLFYGFLVNTSMGRGLYRGIMKLPKVLFRTADFAKATGLINAKLHRFVYVHMDSHEKRNLVYETWLIYRKLVPNLDKIAAQANASNVHLKLIFGTHDSVIKIKDGERFAFKLNHKKSLYKLPSGHQLMNEETVKFIVNNNIWPS